MPDITNDCPHFAIQGGIEKVHSAYPEVVQWLEGLSFNIKYYSAKDNTRPIIKA